MPRYSKSARVRPGSNSPAKSLPGEKAAPPSPQLTESSQPNPPSGPHRSGKTAESADSLSAKELSPEKPSLDATEPFLPELFRVPIPNAVFGRMPGLSDSALRSLLALIRLSFHFDPSGSEWTCSEEWLSRRDVESECGLSSQGTRDGLSELEAIGWARVDRSGEGFQYQLGLEVPTRRFTYVPTALLESAPEIDSGTKLRVVLAVLRGTWGWTCRETNPKSGELETVHDRWIRLSNRKLGEATGRSQTAAAQAARALEGEWIERVRPGNGAHQYRFLPGAIGDAFADGSGDRDSSCPPGSNNLAPDRQKSEAPTFNKKTSSKDRHSRPQEKETPRATGADRSENKRAVPPDKNPGGNPSPQEQTSPGERQKEPPAADFGDLSPEKRDLAETLANVGVWAGRIADLLARYSARRIRANFELYRRRAAEQTIRRPGAWLCQAISEGYALPSSDSTPSLGHKPAPKHKETVSEAEKERYVAQGISEDRFHRCLSPNGDPGGRTYMYLDPKKGGPEQRDRRKDPSRRDGSVSRG